MWISYLFFDEKLLFFETRFLKNYDFVAYYAYSVQKQGWNDKFAPPL